MPGCIPRSFLPCDGFKRGFQPVAPVEEAAVELIVYGVDLTELKDHRVQFPEYAPLLALGMRCEKFMKSTMATPLSETATPLSMPAVWSKKISD
jgi:hypothetical protein